MRRLYLIISLAEVRKALAPQIQAMSKRGVDVHGLLAYSVYAATASDYHTLRQHLIRDVALDVNHQGFEVSAQLIHQCLDFVEQAAISIIPVITRAVGTYNDTVRYERHLGSDAVISVADPSPVNSDWSI